MGGSKTELDHVENKKFTRREGRDERGEGRDGWWWLEVDITEIFSVLLTD